MSTDAPVVDRTVPPPDPPATAVAAEPPPSLWRHGNFNKLWLGHTVSAMGNEITALALPLTAVLFLNASATQVGLLNGLRELSFLGLMLFAGVIVDRFRRRGLLITSDLGRAVLIGLVPVLALVGALTMPVLYVVALGVGALTVLFTLAHTAFLPTVVHKDLLAGANSRLQGSDSAAFIAGPLAGGALVQLVRAPFALVADAVSYLVSALTVVAVRVDEPPPRRDPQVTGARGVFRDIGTGLRVTIAHPVLRTLAGTAATFNFFSGLLLTIFIVYASRSLAMSPAAIGLIFAAFGVGGLLGAMSLGRSLALLGFGRLVVASYGVSVVAIMVVPFVAGPAAVQVALFAVLFAVTGWGIIVSNIIDVTFRQIAVPSERLGRVNASFRFLIGGLLPLSAVTAGVLGDLIGLRETLLVTSAGIWLSLLWLVFSPVPRMRDFTPPGDIE